MKLQKRIGLLVSGGLDSSALVIHCIKRGYKVWPVYVRCGLRWEKAELHWLKKYLGRIKSPLLHPLRLVYLHLDDAYKNNWSARKDAPGSNSSDQAVYLPARNLLLVVKSLLSLSSHNVNQLALATLKGNPFPDAKLSYTSQLGKVLSKSFNTKICIFTPFRNKTKRELIKAYQDASLHLSFSCINPKGIHHCGRCNKCTERKRAFRQAGVEDSTEYARG
ncbi:MAG: 7-cyano-7-deazaguanine synthase [Elusimicrobia bacterium]|nr:7-cyano-7-deazaguanine synthase [Candidatus Obscuribacterium magneticum]